MIVIAVVGSVVAILLALLWVVWHKADWKGIEEGNRQYYNADGEHVYYDRKVIRRKGEMINR